MASDLSCCLATGEGDARYRSPSIAKDGSKTFTGRLSTEYIMCCLFRPTDGPTSAQGRRRPVCPVATAAQDVLFRRLCLLPGDGGGARSGTTHTTRHGGRSRLLSAASDLGFVLVSKIMWSARRFRRYINGTKFYIWCNV